MNRLMVFLDAIRDHLDLHDLPPAGLVTVSTWSEPIAVQLDVTDLSAVAAGLLRWVSSLDDVAASLWRPRSSARVHLIVDGRTPCGVPVKVYGAVPFDPNTFPDLPVGDTQPMPVHLLRSWTTPGEVAA
ncbi:hypothetical protein AB0K15_24050 [Amycolatopsis sp. NPDC049253]|uniref:hypothetical protein n=1 Tax=Amycolatopsis sp. NPDC049253 TaxID=3155274 RepID=UPI003433CDC0